MRALQKLPATVRPIALGAVGLLLALTQSGCLIIGGRSRGGGLYLPGGIVGLLLVIVVLSSLRRR